MKIGSFARKFNINVSTVRFYVNNGLLLPKREGSQYNFDKECIADMERILKYKDYYFTLEEIQLLFFLEKASRFRDEIVLDVCADMMRNKRKELQIQKGKLEQLIDELSAEEKELATEIRELKEQENDRETSSGLPILMIPHLYCPGCQTPLELLSASLSHGSIKEGILSCSCGYSAEIKQGVIFGSEYLEETPFKAFENVESVMAIKDQFSPLYRKLISKAYLQMYHFLSESLKEKNLFLVGPFTFNFILEYASRFSGSNTFLIFDPSYSRIKKIRQYLTDTENCSFVYYVGRPENIPLKRGIFDYYIDDYSTVNSLFTYNDFHTELVAPFLKRQGEVAGIFTTYEEAPESLKNFRVNHPDFEYAKMRFDMLKAGWAQNGVRIDAAKFVGETNPTEIHFPQNEKGEKIKVLAYRGHNSARR